MYLSFDSQNSISSNGDSPNKKIEYAKYDFQIITKLQVWKESKKNTRTPDAIYYK